MSPETRPRVVFVPKIEATEGTSERSPMMLRILRRSCEVQEVPCGAVSDFSFDQRRNRLARYLAFPLGELTVFARTLSTLRMESGVVFAEGSYFALSAGLAAKLRSAPLMWDNHGNVRTFGRAIGKSSAFIAGNEALERFLVSLSSNVLVVSEKEKNAYAAAGFPSSKLMVVPTCVDTELSERSSVDRDEARKRLGIPADAKLVLFFGTLSYGPNLEAARSIASSIAPAVRKGLPEASFAIAGGGCPPGAIRGDVEMLGYVPDIHPWMCAADVCIAPIWSGVGILTKVLDMLSHSRPVVVSPLALDGIPELRHGANCLVGEDPSSFAEQVVTLLTDPVLGERLGRAGRSLVESKYSCTRIGAQVVDLVRDLVEEGTRGAR